MLVYNYIYYRFYNLAKLLSSDKKEAETNGIYYTFFLNIYLLCFPIVLFLHNCIKIKNYTIIVIIIATIFYLLLHINQYYFIKKRNISKSIIKFRNESKTHSIIGNVLAFIFLFGMPFIFVFLLKSI